MSDSLARPPGLPPRPSVSGGVDRPALLDIITVSVPPGFIEPPPDGCHVLDMHLGQAVHVTCSVDSRTRRGLQAHGHFTIVPAGAVHRWTVAQPASALLVRITPSLVRETAEAMGLGARAQLLPMMQMRDPYIERICWMLQAEDHDAYPGGRVFSDSLAAALVARLLSLQTRRMLPETNSARALSRWRLRNVVEYIEAHLDEDLTLAELAAVADYSVSHFKPLFKQAAGMPVHRFVLERRVERARLLLLAGQKSLADIALETGFAHPSHMARCMRRVLGLTPTQVADSSE